MTMSISTYRQYQQALGALKPVYPLAYLDLDLLHENIRAILHRAASKKIRVASKSLRSVAVLKRIQSALPTAQGVMCYSPYEAIHLSRHGLDDLLVAYPTMHEAAVAAVCAEVREGKTIILMLDSPQHVALLQRVAARENVVLPVCLDLDLSYDLPGLHFGVWRSSVTDVSSALRLFETIAASPHLRLDGLMGYEAQIAGVGDVGGLKQAFIRLLKQRSIPALRQRRLAVVNALTARGAALRFVNGGGTGSLESTAQEAIVTEVAVGSAFYAPALFDHYTAFRHLPAAGFALEIVRQPQPDIFTCFGGGYVASGSAGKDKLPQPYLPHGAQLIELEGAGEVQTPVRYRGSAQLALGDPIFFRHAKAGELCEHFNSLHLISNGRIADEVPTYRGEGCKF